MKKIYIIVFLVLSVFANAQIINFPDASFKAKLLQSSPDNNIAGNNFELPIVIDTNNNGEIELIEAQEVHVLDVSNASISDLTGISNFPNLRWLRCSNNSITEITIDNSITIYQLFASHNQISSVNVNFGSDLEGLDLSYNNLSSFAIDGVTIWETFNLSHNHIANLSLNNVGIDFFDVSNNNLSQIQFSGNVWFFHFANFMHNEFTLLDLSNTLFDYDTSTIILGYNTEDTVLFNPTSKPGNLVYSSDNTIFDMGNLHATTSCDPEYTGNYSFSSCPNLQTIIFKNGITHGYVSCDEGGTIFQKPSLIMDISNCPSLNHICVDAGSEQTVIQSRVNQLGLQNQVEVNSNCTSSVLDAKDFSSNEPFVIYPNPVQNILQIQSNDNLEIITIDIYNNLGQIVQKEIGNQQNIDVSRLAKGSYYLKIYASELTTVKQFFKE